MTELKLDLLLRIDYECDSDFVVRLLGHTPKSYYRKGAPTPWRHPRRYPWTLCEYEFVMDPASICRCCPPMSPAAPAISI